MTELEKSPVGNFNFELSFHKTALNATGAEPAGENRSDADKARAVAGGTFAECTGLEATMEPRVIREGGLNYGAHQRSGAVSFATVILRRGITDNGDLWKWFALSTQAGGYAYRVDVEIHHLDAARNSVRGWKLFRALPVKLKSSDLNARGGEVAVEELHLVHEGLTML
ncbi:MAG TPA: phage tail protein [Verrucomicrobiae bacterium]|jgi:phage tail-like protein